MDCAQEGIEKVPQLAMGRLISIDHTEILFFGGSQCVLYPNIKLRHFSHTVVADIMTVKGCKVFNTVAEHTGGFISF